MECRTMGVSRCCELQCRTLPRAHMRVCVVLYWWSGVSQAPVHVGASSGVGHGASALAALHTTLDVPEKAKPVLHENVATLPCALPSDLDTLPSVGWLAPVPVHNVAATIATNAHV